jgi:cell division protein FtsI (penicillin-binding protein 3)
VNSRKSTGSTPVNARDLNDPRVIQEAQGARRETAPPALDWSAAFGRRLVVLGVLFALWVTGIEARLLYLQVLDHEDMMDRASRQQEDREIVPGTRGDIVDRHGAVLAMSVRGHALMVARRLVTDPDALASRVCKTLEGCELTEQRNMAAIMRPVKGRATGYPFLRRDISETEMAKLIELNEPALRIDDVIHRSYPNGQTAAHVLGFVNIDNEGQTGIEKAQEKRIAGKPGKQIVTVMGGARRTRLSSRLLETPTTGATIELTIDKDLQFMVERLLEDQIAETDAEGGTVIVMDPMNGDILAMANAPTFDPNDVGASKPEARQNRAALHIYEPGSTFKLVTASAAVMEEHTSLNKVYDTFGGQIRFGTRVIRDMHNYGPLTFTDIFVRSSNVGAIRVGLELGPEIISRYVSRFGFGEVNARDIPHQRAGIVDRQMATLKDSALASISMGYQIGVTPLQVAAAYASIANGGELLAPRLVRAVVSDGRRVEAERVVVRRTVTPEAAAQVTSILEQVVSSEHGTARGLRIAGYTIGAKTGTAHKVINGRYAPNDYNASFVGFLPSRHPRAVVLAVIDTPHRGGYTGAVIAGPLFKKVAEATLRHLGIPPNVDAAPPVLVARNEVPPPTESAVAMRTAAVMQPAIDSAARDGVMPDVRGLSARDALRVLARLGIEARISGDGFVALQDIAPGTPLDKGRICTLALRRQLIPIGETAGTSQ